MQGTNDGVTDESVEQAPNTMVADLAATAVGFLGEHPGLPKVDTLTVEPKPLLSGYAQINLALDHWVGLGGLAQWAQALGVSVRIAEASSAVETYAWTNFHGYSVKVRGPFLKHGDAWRLLMPLGLEVSRDGVEVDPALLLGDSATGATAAA